MTARSYPWARLPRVNRPVQASVTALRGALEASPVSRAVASLAEVVASPLVVTVETAVPDLSTTLDSHAVAFRVAPAAVDGTPWWIVLEVEPGLIAPLVALVMKRPPPRIIHAGLPTPAMLGAFAAILAAALRRVDAPVVVTPVATVDWATPGGEGVTVGSFSVMALGQTTHARAAFPTALLAATWRPFGRADLAALGDMPLTLPIVACRTRATVADIAALAVGDVCMLDDAWTLGPAATPRGRVVLCASSAERGRLAEIEADGRFVLREGVEELGWSPMDETADGADTLAEAVGEVPVVVRVEIGAAVMRARDWSQLRPGDVIGLGSKIGAPVTLRVSGLAIAEGELVDLDGEVGVRIRRRLATDAGAGA